MFQKLKKGQIVLHTTTNRKGKVIGFEGSKAVIEFILEQNNEDNTRTTKLEKINQMELRPVENTRKKGYNPYKDVMDFHTAFSHPVASIPAPVAAKRMSQRADYTVEEVVESLWASVNGDREEFHKLVSELVANVYKAEEKCNEKGTFPSDETLVHQVDSMIDILYFTYGTLVELGINPKPLFEIVQNSNLSKLDDNGQPIIHPVTNKIMKSANFIEPEPMIKKEIERQIEVAKKRNGGL